MSQLFDPETSIKGLEFARRLTELGHEVEVVTTFPSYPGGKVFDGYKMSWIQRSVIDGVRVVRLPTFVSHGHSAVRRMLSYISFGIVASFYSLFFMRRPDVLYAYYPPVIVGMMAILVSGLRRIPFVYDVQDLWPDVLVATGVLKVGRITASIDRACSWIYKRAARIVVISDGYSAALKKKGVPEEKIERIFNWCDEGRMLLDARPNGKVFEPSYFNVLYAGNMGAAQALEHVIEAANLLEKKGERRVKFVFLGGGISVEKLKKKAADLALNNVSFFPQVPVEKVGGIILQADALLVHLADERIFEITIPSKTQAYLRMGKPILMAVKGEAAEIVDRAGAGIVVAPCRPEELARAVTAMMDLPEPELKAMGARARAYYEERMSMRRGVERVDLMLKEIVAGR